MTTSPTHSNESVLYLGGSIYSAVTHFTLYGLADILESHFGADVRLGWDCQQNPPRAWIYVKNRSLDEMMSAVALIIAHDSQIPWKYRKKYSELSPRITNLKVDLASWSEMEASRHAVLDSLTSAGSLSTLIFLRNLGRPCFWRSHVKKLEKNAIYGQDHAASTFEMVSRKSGRDFIGFRYWTITKALTKWNPGQLLHGFQGIKTENIVSTKNKINPQSSTGFSSPKPIDGALSFACLRGIAMVPLCHKIDGPSVTAGEVKWSQFEPKRIFLPVMSGEVTPARLRTLLQSENLILASHENFLEKGSEKPQVTTNSYRTALQWYEERQVSSFVIFPKITWGDGQNVESYLSDGKIWSYGR